MAYQKKPYVHEKKEDRDKRRACSIFVGMTRMPTEQDFADVREMVLSDGIPLMNVTGEAGGRWGYYLKLIFEEGWNDLEKMVDIAAALQLQLGAIRDPEDPF